jgi:hypothetical protein
MKYYIQDARQYVGNCILFWGKNSSGYVTDINKAGLYSEEKAKEICKNRKTDIAWPEYYVQERTQRTCDSQYFNKKESKFNGKNND